MESKRLQRPALIALELFSAITAIGGAIALLGGWITYPLDWLQGSPFSDYTIPALLLLLVVGGSQIVAAGALLQRRDWAAAAGILAGVIMAGWIAVEVAIVGSQAGLMRTLQITYLVVGLVGAALAMTLGNSMGIEERGP